MKKLTIKTYRRSLQVFIALAFIAIPYLNSLRINVFRGNFLSFYAAGVPLADPLAVLQVSLKNSYLSTSLLIGAGIALCLALSLGTVFCSWVCPYGLLSELVQEMSQRILPKKFKGLMVKRRGFPVKVVVFGLGFSGFFFFSTTPVLNQLSMPAWYSRIFQFIFVQHHVSLAIAFIMILLFYVLKTSKGARGTTYFFDDRLKAFDGCYQRFTPSMVTKKLSQYSLREDMYRFRLTSLNPLNPENTPDEFEKIALKKFKRKTSTEAFRLEHRSTEKYLHYVVPLTMDNTCLKCHRKQGFAEGSMGGGLSILLPLGDMKSSLMRDYIELGAAGAGLIILTISTLFVMLRRMVIRPMKELELMTAEISKGNLEARVDISTGDEVEKLGKAFNEMAEKLSESRNVLKKKIEQATRELSEANQELQTLDKLKSDFLANMSHELRSPLTVIRGGIDYLNRTIERPENRHYLAIIDKNLTRLIHLVSDLFDFTRIEAKKADWTFSCENLSWLIKEVIDIIGPLAMEKDISICYKYDRDILVDMDLERIEQVLVNLIENAIKFSDNRSRIEIDIAEKDNEVEVSVRDYGIGISEENLEVIFEKFHTVPSSGGKDKREGTGLGLAICKGIVEAHKGRIWVESVKGGGSVFHFTLPKECRGNTDQ